MAAPGDGLAWTDVPRAAAQFVMLGGMRAPRMNDQLPAGLTAALRRHALFRSDVIEVFDGDRVVAALQLECDTWPTVRLNDAGNWYAGRKVVRASVANNMHWPPTHFLYVRNDTPLHADRRGRWRARTANGLRTLTFAVRRRCPLWTTVRMRAPALALSSLMFTQLLVDSQARRFRPGADGAVAAAAHFARLSNGQVDDR